MIPHQLNQLVNERRQKCEEKSLYIDMFQKKAKGYCKARDVLAFPQKVSHNKITQPISNISSPSGVFDSVLKELGVDYIG